MFLHFLTQFFLSYPVFPLMSNFFLLKGREIEKVYKNMRNYDRIENKFKIQGKDEGNGKEN